MIFAGVVDTRDSHRYFGRATANIVNTNDRIFKTKRRLLRLEKRRSASKPTATLVALKHFQVFHARTGVKKNYSLAFFNLIRLDQLS